MAGQDAVAPPKALKQCHHNFPLKGVSVEKYEDYANACKVALPLEHIRLLHEAFHGKPSQFAYFIRDRREKANTQEAQYAR